VGEDNNLHVLAGTGLFGRIHRLGAYTTAGGNHPPGGQNGAGAKVVVTPIANVFARPYGNHILMVITCYVKVPIKILLLFLELGSGHGDQEQK